MTRQIGQTRKDMTASIAAAKEAATQPVERKLPFSINFMTKPVKVGELIYCALMPHNLQFVDCVSSLTGPGQSFLTLAISIDSPDGSVVTHEIKVMKEGAGVASLVGGTIAKGSKLRISVIDAGGPPEELVAAINFEIL